jgi:hypothetical protein
MVQQEGADTRGFWGGKALFPAQDQLKTGQNAPFLFTDKLMGCVSKLLIHSDLRAMTG